MSPTYTITPILCGMLQDVDWSNQTLRRHIGEKISVPCIIWLVRGPGLTVVVDSGPGDPDSVKETTGRRLVCEETPQAALSRLRVDPADVRAVLLSHLHWDHSGGLDLFPNAHVYVQRRELLWAIAPLPVQSALYGWRGENSPLPKWLHSRPRMRLVDGDWEFAPGLRCIHLPGHTPGCMGVCCDTTDGRYMIACDASPMFENIEDNVPPGTYVDLYEAYASLARIRDLSDAVLPGHDKRVLDEPCYPPPRMAR